MKKAFLLFLFLLPIMAFGQSARSFFDLGAKARDHYKKIEYFNKAIALKSDYAEAYLYRAISKRKLKDYDGAMADLNTSIKYKPDYAPAYNSRAGLNKKLGNDEAAMADYNKAIKFHPGYAMAYNNRGLMNNRLGEYEQAVRDFDKAIELKPSFKDAFHNRGFSKMELKQYEAAIEDFDKAISLDPKDHYAHNNRGATYNYMGDRSKALRDLGKAIEVKPNYYEAYANRAAVLLTVRQFELAKADCEKALEIRPGYQKVEVTLKAIEREKKQYTEHGPSLNFKHEAPLRAGVLNILPTGETVQFAYSFESDRPVEELQLSILVNDKPSDLFDLKKVRLVEQIMDRHYKYLFSSSVSFSEPGYHTLSFDSANDDVRALGFISFTEFQVELPAKKAHTIFWLPEVEDEVLLATVDSLSGLLKRFNTFQIEEVKVMNGKEATLQKLKSALNDTEEKLSEEPATTDNYFILFMSAKLEYSDEAFYLVIDGEKTKLDLEEALAVSEYGPFRPLLFFHGHLTDQSAFEIAETEPYDELNRAFNKASNWYQFLRLSGKPDFNDLEFISQLDKLIFRLRADYNSDGFITLQEFHNEATRTRKEGLYKGLGKIHVDWSNYRVGKSKDFVLSESVNVR